MTKGFEDDRGHLIPCARMSPKAAAEINQTIEAVLQQERDRHPLIVLPSHMQFQTIDVLEQAEALEAFIAEIVYDELAARTPETFQLVDVPTSYRSQFPLLRGAGCFFEGVDSTDLPSVRVLLPAGWYLAVRREDTIWFAGPAGEVFFISNNAANQPGETP